MTCITDNDLMHITSDRIRNVWRLKHCVNYIEDLPFVGNATGDVCTVRYQKIPSGNPDTPDQVIKATRIFIFTNKWEDFSFYMDDEYINSIFDIYVDRYIMSFVSLIKLKHWIYKKFQTYQERVNLRIKCISGSFRDKYPFGYKMGDFFIEV